MDDDYRRRGFKHLRGVLPTGLVDELAASIDRSIPPYGGEIQRQDGRYETNRFFPSSTLVRNAILNAHEALPEPLAPIRNGMRALLTCAEMYRSLHAIDGADHYTVHQSIIFMAAQKTTPHLDSWSLDTAPHGYAHTIWVPLEDLDYLAGVPAVVAWPIGKLVPEADLGIDASQLSFRERHDRYCVALTQKLSSEGTDFYTSFMRRGDLLIWGSLTPHFSLPSFPEVRRRLSLQVLIRPTHHRWGTYATQPPEWEPTRSEEVSQHFAFCLH